MKKQDQTQQKNQIPDSKIFSLFENFGFTNLTEIQKKASPIVLQKKDCLIIAPTGSGKTECSVIPIFSLIKNSRNVGKIKALYITPLRALNRDVFRRITKYAHENELSIEIRHGDTTQSARKKITENPPDVLITTPETLVILLTQQKMLDALSELEWIVIDEVHELLASERGAQLSLSIERLQLISKFPLTKIGLSATVGNFEEAGKFVVGSKRKCQIIRDTSVRKYDVEVQYVDGTISDVADKILEYVKKQDLDSPILLFTNTRGEAEFLASILKEKSSEKIELHHGSLSKEVREDTELTLREGKRGIVVCTSSLELGLDIGSVDLVIHYGSPRQVSKLVQRIGRSRHNRDASARGLIITNNADDEFEARAILDRIKEGSIEEQKIHDGSLDVLAHHLVGLTMQIGEIPVDFALTTIRNAYPFRNLKLEDLIGVLDLLDSNYLIFFDRTKMTFWKKGRSFKYYFENLSTIPDILKFKVFDSVGKKIIGTLDQRFVGDFGDSGNIFVLKGTQWRILNIDEKSLSVNVEPFRGGGITVPYWEGENIPIDYNTAKKVGLFRTKVRKGYLNLINKTIENLNFEISNENSIVIESSKTQGSIVIHSCFGTKINSTLSTLLSSMLSSLLGSIVDSRSDGYRIVLSSRSRISEKLFLEVLKDDYDLYSIVTASLSGTHNVNWRTWCVAKKFGVVGRGAIYEKKSARFLYERYSKTSLVKEALRELFHDKYDLSSTEKILKKIREDEISVKWIEVDKFSKLAEPILDHTTKYYSSPANLDKGILDLVKTRLAKTKHRLICARCGKWERVIETNEVKNILICPYCKGRQITATFYSDYDLPKIIRKKHDGKKLTSEEKHKFDRAWKVSSLIENFGKTAITVISGYGVGADTAARILRNMVDEEHLLKQIYEAERQYVVTRGFWDS
ncbi:DEAD/DEAH box helicase [Nitrosopumilus sp. K4]|uniref:DEAD/DEAH box helicase n=1 Tax=Nitrosopumilus sp. K4 TaxID=2795383 RepID=UPI001BADACD2|nr:DEAD/DEAH box helicase [Nitrosopumilus sp. K4]QUC64484.1 DEAD/DEAH box helicase [Nitrosopumilus sp. K4]